MLHGMPPSPVVARGPCPLDDNHADACAET